MNTAYHEGLFCVLFVSITCPNNRKIEIFIYTSSLNDHGDASCKFSNNCHLKNQNQNVSSSTFLPCILKVSDGIQIGIFELKYPKVYFNHELIFDQLAVPEFMQLILKVQCPALAIFCQLLVNASPCILSL